MKKIKYPDDFEELLKGDKKCSPLDKLGWWLVKEIELPKDKLIDVSKIWVTENTYDKLKDICVEYFKRVHKCSKVGAQKNTSMLLLMSAPAVDFDNKKETSDEYIVLMDDCVRDRNA